MAQKTKLYMIYIFNASENEMLYKSTKNASLQKYSFFDHKSQRHN